MDVVPSISSAMVAARRASPRKTGQIGWPSPRTWKPAAVMAERKRCVLAATFCDNPLPPTISSNACAQKNSTSVRTSQVARTQFVFEATDVEQTSEISLKTTRPNSEL